MHFVQLFYIKVRKKIVFRIDELNQFYIDE
jgi:hypothetical protein